MCGRYAVTLPPEAMATLFASLDRPNLPPRWNVAPTQMIPICAIGKAGDRRLISARWGLRPAWMEKDPPTGPLFNARSETAPEKPAFRSAFKAKRCLIPADGFYEWRKEGKTRTPFFIHRADGAPMVFAGLWESAKGPDGAPLISAAILTAAAGPDTAALHDRVPVLVNPPDFSAWLDRETPLNLARALMHAPPDGALTYHEVGPRVGAVANDDASLVAPVGAGALL